MQSIRIYIFRYRGAFCPLVIQHFATITSCSYIHSGILRIMLLMNTVSIIVIIDVAVNRHILFGLLARPIHHLFDKYILSFLI